MKTLFVICAMLSGCYPHPYIFKLQDGSVVSCRQVIDPSTDNPCGLYLSKCDDGATYWCQQNVVEWSDDVNQTPELGKDFRKGKKI